MFSGSNPVGEDRQVGLFPSALAVRHPHVTQRRHPARPDFRLHLFESGKMFDNRRSDQPVGIVIQIRGVIVLRQSPLVKKQQRKTEYADLVGGNIAHARRVRERLFQFLVRQSAMGEPCNGVSHCPNIDGEVQELQPGFLVPPALAQCLQ